MQQPHILIADDHEIVRLGLRMILKKDYPQATFTEAVDGSQVMEFVRSRDFDLVITDIHMPDTDTMSMVEQLLAEKPDLKILVISMHPEDIFAVRYMKAGCYGYANKGIDFTTLGKAARTILTEGKKYVSDYMLKKLSQDLWSGKKSTNPFEDLSNREMEVIMQLAKGLSIAQVAETLKIHPSTVTSHKARSFDKLQIDNVIALRQLFETYGML